MSLTIEKTCGLPVWCSVGGEGLQMLAALVPSWPPQAMALIETGQLARAPASVDGLESAAAARGLDMDARLLGLRARLAKARGKLEEADGFI